MSEKQPLRNNEATGAPQEEQPQLELVALAYDRARASSSIGDVLLSLCHLINVAVENDALFLEDVDEGHKRVLVCQLLSNKRVRVEASHSATLECDVSRLLIRENGKLYTILGGDPLEYGGPQKLDGRCFGSDVDELRRRGTALAAT